MKAQLFQLSELGEIVSGSTPRTGVREFWNGDIPWVTPADLTNHDGIWFQGRPKSITRAGFESCSTRMLPRGSILFSSRAPIGHCALAPYTLCTNQGFKNLVPNDRLDPVYGYFALRFATPAIVARGRGATFAEVSTEIMESVQIPVPSRAEQERIAAQLQNADLLRRTRRFALELSDKFLASAFLEFFGDPIKNSHGFEYSRLGQELERIESGFSPVCDGPRMYTTEWAVLGLGAVTSGVFKPQENKRLPGDVAPRPELEVKDGDVLVTRKNTYELVAACAHVMNPPPHLLLPDTIFRFRLKTNSKLTPFYLSALVSFPSFRKTVQKLASGSAGSMPNISKEKFMNVRCPAPPLSLQREFAVVVERSQRLRSVHREALRQAEHLFETLLYSSFETQL